LELRWIRGSSWKRWTRKLLAKNGSHNVHTITLKEWEWFTILTCINAKGASIPNFYIFKGKRMSRNYIVHWESGATRPCNPRPRWLISYFKVGLHILWNMWVLAWMEFNLQINIFWSSMDMVPMWPLMLGNIKKCGVGLIYLTNLYISCTATVGCMFLQVIQDVTRI